jgi:hypothetical protein
MKIWQELNLQQKSLGWLKLAKSQRLFQHGLLPVQTVKLEITLSKDETGALGK